MSGAAWKAFDKMSLAAEIATTAAPMSNPPAVARIADDLAPVARLGGDAYAVFVASDVRLYSEGLALVFAADGRLRVSHVADTAERTVLFIRDTGADALLLDASMRGARAVLDDVSARAPHTPIILFGVSALTTDLADCVHTGATAFVSRDATSKELILTLLAAIRGEAMLSRGPLARIEVHSERGEPLRLHARTDRSNRRADSTRDATRFVAGRRTVQQGNRATSLDFGGHGKKPRAPHPRESCTSNVAARRRRDCGNP